MSLHLSNLDAAESVFFLREHEQVKARSYDKLYPELKARRFIPPSPEPAPNGAETITFRKFDRVGAAKLIASYADDIPRVDVFGEEVTTRIAPLGVAYAYNLQEVRAAAMANRPLPQMRADAARKAMEEQIDLILALGNTATSITGFLNNANVPQAAVATVNSTTTWAQKVAADPDRVLADITDAIADMVELTKGVEMPDTLLMPIGQYMLLSTTRLVDQAMTLLEYIRAKFPMLTLIDHWYRLTGAGASVTDRFVVYKRSADKLWYEVPQEFESLAVQEVNFEFKVPCHARIGGVIIPYPLSLSYRDGI